ncbi:diguanylate cyclase [Alginatibacterium sediminis]|uniref:Diguanylate cyclase n=1 Tax=Alginatibacterium sediminis TaxID=2164068 RepID=A0A420E833_9ALTE|nr:diguanylate cyclase [Alginatibacterium sediminis]RKF15571.1 diguanylate cyclase [Alginatibacterium sediminis]
MKLPIRVILTITMTLIALIPISVFSFWTTNTALEREFEAVEEKHLLLAKNLTLALNRYAMDLKSAFVAGTQAVELTRLGSEYRLLMQQLNLHSLIRVSDEGQVLQSVFGDQAYFDDPVQRQAIVKMVQTNPAPLFTPVLKFGDVEPNLYIAKESIEGDYWIAAISLAYIYSMQRSIAFGEKGHAAIVDQRGRVLAHPNKQWQREAKDISSISIVQKQIAGQTGVEQFYSPAMKSDMIAGYSSVPQTGWGVMIPQPVSELYENIRHVQDATIIIAIITSICAIGLSWILSGIFSQPVRRLTVYAQQISQQTQAIPIDFPRALYSNEIGALSNAMQQMSLEISQHREVLEQKVQERTAELNKIKDHSLHLAQHDLLTSLPNRLAIHQLIEQQYQSNSAFALLFLDLDGFKPLNDEYGHQFGDKVLQAVASRLSSINKGDDKISRYGGDEFLILLNQVDNAEAAQTIVERFISSVRQPYSIESRTIYLSASIGFALSSQAQGVDEIIHLADKAMYNAKASGKDQFYAYATS